MDLHESIPLHVLNSPQTRLWLVGMSEKHQQLRRQMGSSLAKIYRSGCGVLSATLRLIAYVDPRGVVTDLPPPHRKYELWQAANRPRPPECACMSFTDPENGGRPWRDRGDRRGNEHHPFCQFKRTASKAYEIGVREGGARIAQGGPVHERPDEWIRIEERVKES